MLLLDKMNWAMIECVNSLLTMMSKDGKTSMSYTKCQYLSKTQRNIKKIKKIKKEKITNL